MALINGTNGIPATNLKAVATPKAQVEPPKPVIEEPIAKVEGFKPKGVKMVNSKKTN